VSVESFPKARTGISGVSLLFEFSMQPGLSSASHSAD
jgi:hypothetical protein